MKIIFIIGSLSGGGAERVVSELSSQMSKQGDSVKIILIAQNKVSYDIDKEVEIIDCTSTGETKKGLSFIKRISNIRAQIKSLDPDVCISFTVGVNIYSILSCIFLKCRLIISERNDPRYDPTDKFSRVLRKILYPFADVIVFQTKGEQEFFSKGIQKKSIVIPNPVNSNMPEPFTGTRRKVFVSAARLSPQKNIIMAIDAFAIVYRKYPEFKYEIYGDGPLKSSLQEYININHLSETVTLKGSSNHLYHDISDAYAFLLSSNYEGISNSMLEAMALGLPTISTDYPSGGAREIISNGESGFVVPVGDTKEMAKKMIFLIENNESYSKISRKSIEVKDTFNLEKINRKWAKLIKDET